MYCNVCYFILILLPFCIRLPASEQSSKYTYDTFPIAAAPAYILEGPKVLLDPSNYGQTEFSFANKIKPNGATINFIDGESCDEIVTTQKPELMDINPDKLYYQVINDDEKEKLYKKSLKTNTSPSRLIFENKISTKSAYCYKNIYDQGLKNTPENIKKGDCFLHCPGSDYTDDLLEITKDPQFDHAIYQIASNSFGLEGNQAERDSLLTEMFGTMAQGELLATIFMATTLFKKYIYGPRYLFTNLWIPFKQNTTRMELNDIIMGYNTIVLKILPNEQESTEKKLWEKVWVTIHENVTQCFTISEENNIKKVHSLIPKQNNGNFIFSNLSHATLIHCSALNLGDSLYEFGTNKIINTNYKPGKLPETFLDANGHGHADFTHPVLKKIATMGKQILKGMYMTTLYGAIIHYRKNPTYKKNLFLILLGAGSYRNPVTWIKEVFIDPEFINLAQQALNEGINIHFIYRADTRKYPLRNHIDDSALLLAITNLIETINNATVVELPKKWKSNKRYASWQKYTDALYKNNIQNDITIREEKKNKEELQKIALGNASKVQNDIKKNASFDIRINDVNKAYELSNKTILHDIDDPLRIGYWLAKKNLFRQKPMASYASEKSSWNLFNILKQWWSSR